MIRHASLYPAQPIATLAIAMVESSFQRLLVPTVGSAALLPTCSLPTLLAAVALSPVTVAADPEDGAALTGPANSLTENNLGSDRHPRPKARLDNGHRSWQVKTVCEDGYLMKVCHRDPGRSHGRGPDLPAFGDKATP